MPLCSRNSSLGASLTFSFLEQGILMFYLNVSTFSIWFCISCNTSFAQNFYKIFLFSVKCLTCQNMNSRIVQDIQMTMDQDSESVEEGMRSFLSEAIIEDYWCGR